MGLHARAAAGITRLRQFQHDWAERLPKARSEGWPPPWRKVLAMKLTCGSPVRVQLLLVGRVIIEQFMIILLLAPRLISRGNH
jgi:hypothetical protein